MLCVENSRLGVWPESTARVVAVSNCSRWNLTETMLGKAMKIGILS